MAVRSYAMLVLSFLFAGKATIATAAEDADCAYVDRTLPKMLTSMTGTAKDPEFFETISDADQDDDTLTYTRIVRNLSGKFYLQIKWDAAKIDTREISPERCYRNQFQSHYLPDDGKKSSVQFGNGLQKQIDDVHVYTETDKLAKNDSAPKKDDPPKKDPEKSVGKKKDAPNTPRESDKLTSKIYTTVRVPSEGRDIVIDFTFESYFDAHGVKYTVESKTKQLFFAFQTEEEDIAKLWACRDDFKTVSQWKYDEKAKAYSVFEGKAVLEMAGKSKFQEKLVKVKLSTDSGVSVSGVITVHFPLKAK